MIIAAAIPGLTDAVRTHTTITSRDIYKHTGGIDRMTTSTMIMTGTNNTYTAITEAGSRTG